MPLNRSSRHGKDPRWKGSLLRWTKLILAFLSTLSFTVLIPAALWGSHRRTMAVQAGFQPPSGPRLAFYSGTMPLLTLLFTVPSYVLTFFGLFPPLLALSTSILLLLGWISQITVWMYCETNLPSTNITASGVITFTGASGGNDGYSWCPTAHALPTNAPDTLGQVKNFLGMVVGVILVLYVCVAAVAAWRDSVVEEETRILHISHPLEAPRGRPREKHYTWYGRKDVEERPLSSTELFD